jgi:hypothetical protein
MYRRRGYSATIDIGKYPVPETDREQDEEAQSLCGLLLDIIKITLCCCCCRLVKHNDDADDDYESCDEMACAIGDSDSEEESNSSNNNDSGSDSSFIEAKGCSSDSDYD